MATLNKLYPCDKFSGSSNNCPSMKKITYTYDSMNRRVARTDENGTTQYLYGNPNHPFQLTAVRSPSGSLSRYHYDDFGLLFALERDNNWYYITTDQLGTPRVVCDADGELVKVLEYDSFGQVMADSNPAFELHNSFAGGLIDGETELVRFGFRDYDAVAGKWTAKDPIGFAGGDTNLYRYVLNTPVKLADPSGLDVALIYNGPTKNNPFGHSAIALSGRGVYSFGNSTPLGLSLTDYVYKQANRRDTTIYIIQTTPQQEQAVLDDLKKYSNNNLPKPFLGFIPNIDTCATRANHAAGLVCPKVINSNLTGNNPGYDFPSDSQTLGTLCGNQVVNIPKGSTATPLILHQFDP